MLYEIKYLISPDIDDLESFIPEKKGEFCFLLQMMIGEKGIEGEESFDITICSPKWLQNNLSEADLLIGRHSIIVQQFYYPQIFNFLNEQLNSCQGDSWEEMAKKMGRIGCWEFEDYRE